MLMYPHPLTRKEPVTCRALWETLEGCKLPLRVVQVVVFRESCSVYLSGDALIGVPLLLNTVS